MAETITGASVWEQQLYDHLCAHAEHERDTLVAYQHLAERTGSEAFKYLAGMILADERRHHELLNDLAETVRRSAALSGDDPLIPHVDFRVDRDEIIALTERFLAVEEEDNRQLEQLAKELKDVRDTTLWALVLRLMQDDNAKHRRILTFIRDHARKHPL